MKVEEIVETTHLVYQNLERENIEQMLNFFTDSAVLVWGPFRFEGKGEIKRWAREFLDLFTSIHIVDRTLNIDKNRIYHKFIIEVVTLNMKKGLMPISGSYDLEGEKFSLFELNPIDSILFLDQRLYDSLRF